MAIENGWIKAFGYKHMQNLAAYLLTQNYESQAFAVDGSNAENVQDTGTKAVMINGVYIPTLPVDLELDISAVHPYAAWADSTAYTLNSEVVNDGVHYVCISAHTSGATDDEPGVGATQETYWRRLDKFAEEAVGDVIADGDTGYYLACALDDGTLSLFKAYDSDGNLQIPCYDPTRYVAIGILKIAASGADYTCGTTSTASISTFYQVVGNLFPDPDLLDVN